MRVFSTENQMSVRLSNYRRKPSAEKGAIRPFGLTHAWFSLTRIMQPSFLVNTGVETTEVS